MIENQVIDEAFQFYDIDVKYKEKCYKCADGSSLTTASSGPNDGMVSTFHCPSQVILRVKSLCYVSVENRMQKYSQGFLCLTCVASKHQIH